MPRHVSTSLLWSLATGVVLIVSMVGAVWLLADRADAYNTAVARATQPVMAEVVRTENYSKGDDLVVVAWLDPTGARREAEFTVDDARGFPDGDDFPLRAVPGTAEVYPVDDRVTTPAVSSSLGITFIVLFAWLPIWYVARLIGWWRASRRPAEPVSMRLYRGESTRSTLGVSRIVWLELVDAAGNRWYQRVMWEPWLYGLGRKAYHVSAQRYGHRKPALVTTTNGGRLYWAGRARRSQPMMIEQLTPGPPQRGGTRWSLVLALLLPIAPGAVLLGWVAGAVSFVGLLALVMLNGAPPLGRRR
jgi:hypothetical protein